MATEAPYNWADDNSNAFDRATANGPRMGRAQQAGRNVGNGLFPGQQPPSKSKTRNGGGFNPSLSFTKIAGGPAAAPTANGNTAGQTGAQGGTSGKVPGSDFMSNEEIRAFCEHHRKKARNLATELAMDADHLEAVLRTIPHQSGNMGGARARSRRVSRWLKKAAAAEKAKQKYFASLYGTFEREYDSELRKIGKGTRQPRTTPVTQKFGWK